MTLKTKVAIIGAGPAGLTAGYLLSKKQIDVTVLEADSTYVGGISKTVSYKGFHFDIGGHRFFSKSQEVESLWTEILPHDMLDRPRSSRIYYRNKFYSYPLKAFEALTNLGIWESFLCVVSYFRARLNPVRNPNSFEDWVSNQFGKRLFSIFFKTYTEKVWGMPCKKISSDWAAQRIKGLSLGKAVWHALVPQKKSANRGQVIKTLIDSFRYPRLGPGMMWDAASQKMQENGGRLVMGAKASRVEFDSQAQEWTVHYQDAAGAKTLRAKHVISSAPLRELVSHLTPTPPVEVVKAAQGLSYRDFLTVALMIKEKNVFDDNWIYIHDATVKVGRIQNFKSWSPEMIPDQSLTCYGLEYFCFEGDGLWNSTDQELVELAKKELVSLGLAKASDVVDGCVVRQPKAYPVYDHDYAARVDTIRNYLEQHYPGLHLVGRNGMHKYNNQDHAMMTAMLTVENIVSESKLYDVWRVNQDAEYHEEGASAQKTQWDTTGRLVPREISTGRETSKQV